MKTDKYPMHIALFILLLFVPGCTAWPVVDEVSGPVLMFREGGEAGESDLLLAALVELRDQVDAMTYPERTVLHPLLTLDAIPTAEDVDAAAAEVNELRERLEQVEARRELWEQTPQYLRADLFSSVASTLNRPLYRDHTAFVLGVRPLVLAVGPVTGPTQADILYEQMTGEEAPDTGPRQIRLTTLDTLNVEIVAVLVFRGDIDYEAIYPTLGRVDGVFLSLYVLDQSVPLRDVLGFLTRGEDRLSEASSKATTQPAYMTIIVEED